ncbi:Gfo/Idh/MocA family protein [Mahella australiensis]|uniref:Alpha-N-acetylgalactosaminidase n=1 Tax=Mahella australiensis (strain DSM 15567 / CIP 107919 / 50-1 BON) TaxID=697281 RepID=F3ZWF6_MAHA5|nr:Gfo/Idh/MocA family oxidoreductase [Mahella australiensis]AEE95391.1 Alpha-N-acetylgalactosaminidase [Mahella australiensis 50-1 BON]
MERNNSNEVVLGVIGLGGRGRGLSKILLDMEDVSIPAICDVLDDRVQMAADQFESLGRPRPQGYSDYKELLARDDIQGVIIATSWTTHAMIAVDAMKAGKYTASEVGGASSIEECWELVRTSEQTGIPCMMLENCCYGRNEMALLNMVKKGIFGELIHCQCGYEHDLREEVAMGIENRHYRIHNYLNRNGDVYPTHGLGPVAKYLNINRGNRFLTLSSMASKARGLHNWVMDNLGERHPLAEADFTQGDVATTMIKCAHGETIMVIHDTTLPRPYSRAGRVQGTKGIWMEDNNSIYIEGRSQEHTWESFDKYLDEYEHPLWREYIKMGVRGSHGGMDYLCLMAFVESVKTGLPTPIDVYDMATWMAVTVLSEQSVVQGGHPMPFPDFTKGRWINRPLGPAGKYSLDNVYEEFWQ